VPKLSEVFFCLQLQGGVSSGYKKFVEHNAIEDDTYTEDGIALFRVQGSGPDNMQAIQVEPVLLSDYFVLVHFITENKS